MTLYRLNHCLNIVQKGLALRSQQVLPVVPCRNYAKPLTGKKGKSKLGPAAEKVRLPVETDAVKLVNYVCGSDPVKENSQDVKLKDDSEYPEWLWTLRTEKPPPLEEMDQTTKQYWRRLRTYAMKEKNLMKKVKQRRRL